jgi:hypothetical protein
MANRFFKSLVGSWSLERKCLLFLGLALLGSLVLAFFAVQWVASTLVMETTRQSAKDYANAVIGWKHISTDFKTFDGKSGPSNPIAEELARSQADYRRKVLELLREYMLQSRYDYEILRIDDHLEHESLRGDLATGKDRELLLTINAQLAEQDSILEADTKRAREKAALANPDLKLDRIL